ncbi:MAG: nucleotidyltransferase domain-containing protein [Promethearchaeota archaeon]|nr:MAG: nucleotidyltransferase domain-containing protein [Candidatus Lokiarchaeota archaeon]
MEIIEGIEGDYIKTKNDNLFFDVKGLLHPNDYVICYLRFFPHPDGERIKNSISYKKVYNLNERYTLLRENFPKYLFFSKELDLEVQGVKKEEIKKVYTPRNTFKKLLDKNKLSYIEKNSISLCKLLIDEGNLSDNSIGITGSIMIGLNTEDSDIDIIIYGTETSLKFQEKLEQIFKKSNKIRKYNIDEYRSHYDWRVGGSNIPFEHFLKSEQRKQHQGKFKDHDFFIRYIKSTRDWKGSFYDYKYKNLGRIRLKAEIIDSRNSIFTPCSYKINSIKILEGSTNSNNINIGDINEINSFRGRFCEQARENEKVLVEGKLERVIFNKEIEYYRILLNDPIHDRMIII